MDEWVWTVGLAPALALLERLHRPDAGLLEAPADGHAAEGVPTKLGFRTIDGVRIRCAECGGGPATQAILMTSPWPESMFAFARIWSSLARRFRVIAVDLPGFGGSERRDDLMSPRAMGGFLVRLAEEADLGELHLVAPDVGTSAALYAAALRPDLITSVVVGSGAAAVPLQLEGPLADWTLAPDIGRFRSIDATTVVGAALDTIGGEALAPDIRQDYLDSYAGDRFVESMRYVRSYPEQLPDLARRLPEIDTPVQIIAGRRDRVVPMANAEFLHERLRDSRLAVVDAGHFVWEEAPREYGELVADWASGGYRDAAPAPG